MKQKLLAFLIATLLVVLTCTACAKTETVVICGHCSAKVSENSQYCSNCGGLLFQSNNNPSDTTTIPATDPSGTTTTQTTEPSVHEHSFSTATCTNPSKCECGEIAEEALGHNWGKATCTDTAVCSRCGESSGSALGHDWISATCTSAKTCSRCSKTDGSALGHAWSEATCTSAKTCSRCRKTEGSALGHSHTATKTPATCTAQGYTTYTCKCGDSYVADYVAPAHNYQKYVCTSCGQVDKAHAYEYLIEWVKKNGTTNGNYTEFIYQTGSSKYALSYSAQYDNLSITRGGSYEGTFTFTALYLDTYYYGSGFGDLEMCGYITPSTFTSNTAISYTKYIGDSGTRAAMAELSRANICDLIDWLAWCLNTYDVGITIDDLGFTAY